MKWAGFALVIVINLILFTTCTVFAQIITPTVTSASAAAQITNSPTPTIPTAHHTTTSTQSASLTPQPTIVTTNNATQSSQLNQTAVSTPTPTPTITNNIHTTTPTPTLQPLLVNHVTPPPITSNSVMSDLPRFITAPLAIALHNLPKNFYTYNSLSHQASTILLIIGALCCFAGSLLLLFPKVKRYIYQFTFLHLNKKKDHYLSDFVVHNKV